MGHHGLPELLRRKTVRSELIYMLVTLDREFSQSKPDEAWETFYARRLIEYFSSISG